MKVLSIRTGTKKFVARVQEKLNGRRRNETDAIPGQEEIQNVSPALAGRDSSISDSNHIIKHDKGRPTSDLNKVQNTPSVLSEHSLSDNSRMHDDATAAMPESQKVRNIPHILSVLNPSSLGKNPYVRYDEPATIAENQSASANKLSEVTKPPSKKPQIPPPALSGPVPSDPLNTKPSANQPSGTHFSNPGGTVRACFPSGATRQWKFGRRATGAALYTEVRTLLEGSMQFSLTVNETGRNIEDSRENGHELAGGYQMTGMCDVAVNVSSADLEAAQRLKLPYTCCASIEPPPPFEEAPTTAGKKKKMSKKAARKAARRTGARGLVKTETVNLMQESSGSSEKPSDDHSWSPYALGKSRKEDPFAVLRWD